MGRLLRSTAVRRALTFLLAAALSAGVVLGWLGGWDPDRSLAPVRTAACSVLP